MFCTGHTSMTINELVSYTALIRTEFLDEYKMAHGMMVKKGPGRAKVDDPTPPLVPSLAPPLSLPCTLSLHAPSTTTLTHSHPHPHSPLPSLARYRCTIGRRRGGIRFRCRSQGAPPPRSTLGADLHGSARGCIAPARWSEAGGMTSCSRSSRGEP